MRFSLPSIPRVNSSIGIRQPSVLLTLRAQNMASTTTQFRPRRFAALGKSEDPSTNAAPKLKGVVFDVDGTLWYVEVSYCLESII